jgi:hypothetical protein
MIPLQTIFLMDIGNVTGITKSGIPKSLAIFTAILRARLAEELLTPRPRSLKA